jgi:hypothetical protein
LQANPQTLPTHAGCALATVVLHTLLHALQLFGSLVTSTQLSLQFVGVELVQPDTQA